MDFNFNDLAYLEQYDQQSQASFGHIPHLEQKLQLPTDTYENEQKVKTRSTKKRNCVTKSMRSIQNFSMDDHKLYIQKKSSKFEKFVTLKIQGQQIPQVQIDAKSENLTIQELVNDINMLTSQEKLQFLEDLKYEQDLKCFLRILMQIFNQEMAKDLIVLAHKCWDHYVNLTGRELQPFNSQLLEREGQKCSLEEFNQILNGDFKILTSWKNLNLNELLTKEIQKQFKQFVTGYCKTVFFVIGGYFYNSMLHKQDYEQQWVNEDSLFTFARTYSDASQEESQFSLRMNPQKKRKTN